MKLHALIFAMVAAAASSAMHAQPGAIAQKETDAIIFEFQAAYADTFNRRDAQAMAELLTENATLQNEWGDVTQGRDKIASLVARLMAGLPAGTRLEDTALVSQAIAADTIVSQGISRRLVPGAEPGQMFFSRVLVLRDGRWRLAATQIARPSTVPRPTASP